ncbi:MAG TPA: hypothetical protein VHE35_13215 [Kofleriaceae bacterium]|nr:hypothetical protein [Kofleriaceae bacterium]
MPPVPQISVSVDTDAGTYTFTTSNPSVTPGAQPLPVIRLGNFTIVAVGKNSNITVVATLPTTATVTTPFSPSMQPVTKTAAQYQLTAIGMVTLSVPTYNGQSLTGTPLVVAPATSLTLTESGSSTPSVSYGAIVSLIIDNLQIQTTVTTSTSNLFIGQTGNTATVNPGGSPYQVADQYDGSYNVNGDGPGEQSKMVIPLVGTINVSSTKKPHL